MYDWHSPVYELFLPEGATFEVEFHTAGQPDMSNPLAAVATRTTTAAGGLRGARLAADGMFRLLQPSDDGLQFVASGDPRAFGAEGPGRWSSADAPQSPQVQSQIAPDGSDAMLFYLHEVTPTVLYDRDGVRAKRSYDDGQTWGPEMDIVEGVSMTAADIGPDGGTIYVVGMRDSDPVVVTCSMERDAEGTPILRASDEWSAAGLPELPAGLHFLEIQNNEAHLLVDDQDTLKYFLSTDGLRTWQA